MTTQKTNPPTIAQRLGHAALLSTTAMSAINVDDPNINHIARAIAENMPPYLIFRRDEQYLTVRQATMQNQAGIYPIQPREMTARRLCSFLGDYLIFQKGTGDKAKRVSLSKELAEKILASDTWYDRAAELELILPVRLPVWGETVNGRRSVTLAPVGYDPQRQTYTAETLNYTTGTTRYKPAQLVATWNRLMHTFPWGPENKQEQEQVWRCNGETIQGPCPSTNRSACACLALMLGQYCRLLVDDLMPIGIFNANQQGSGKSLLAWLCIAPVWGMAAGTAAPKNDEEMIKAINAALLTRAPYHMLDDIPVLANNTLNMVATSNEVAGRRLGGLDTFTAKNHMQIFATGNDLNCSPDVERRSLICDLFLATSALERSFKTTLTRKSLAQPGWRADLLRFMCSMVMNWSDAGCPSLVPGSSKPTFESFASVIGSIMVHNGFLSPFTRRQYVGSGGDLIGRSILRLLAHIVSENMGTVRSETYSIRKIVEISDAMELTQTITGGKSPHHSMGKRLEAYRGKILTDEQGLRFEFGKREESGQSCYTFTRIDLPQALDTSSTTPAE